MTLAAFTPTDWVKVIAVGNPERVSRGRPSEFRHRGVALAHRPDAMGALLEVGKDPSAIVLVPTSLAELHLTDFVDVLRSVAHTAVLAGVVPGTSEKTVSELFDHGICGTVALPVTPTRLAEAVRAPGLRAPVEEDVIKLGGLLLDSGRHQVTWNGQDVLLAPKTFELLRYLMLAFPRVVSIDELVREFESGSDEHAMRIRVAVGRLRRAFTNRQQSGSPVVTVHRVGYSLRP